MMWPMAQALPVSRWMRWRRWRFPPANLTGLCARSRMPGQGRYTERLSGRETRGDTPVKLEEYLDTVEALGERFLFIGDGVPVHREAISARLGDRAVFAPAFRGYLRPSAAGWIALNKGTETDYLGLQATYLRPPNAQKNKKLLEAMGHE